MTTRSHHPDTALLLRHHGRAVAVWHLAATALTSEPLETVRAFRARVLYAKGRRPDFRDSTGRFWDPQDLDFGAWHITVDDPTGRPAAYARLCPPQLIGQFQTRDYLGAETFTKITRSLGEPKGVLGLPEGIWEASRLVSDEHVRGQGYGALAQAAYLALARVQGANAVIGLSGTKDGQEKFHQQFGYTTLPDTEGYEPHYTEGVCVVIWPTRQTAGRYEPLVDSLASELANKLAPSSGDSQGTVNELGINGVLI
ncbi:hypothetical protein [Actinomadura rubrisoli]|uniref:GNAT family N-acetyltransferase n=1 Tax=Actinomadura rubrisoli TaxID=2530368 RepID=A0A4R5BVL5_9ACTN|nr:hypothetical protein [Actinomadura rubrisoli]TDD91151.1 hypothetical protein E1298_12275 [Actinomadura rubrisoli]